MELPNIKSCYSFFPPIFALFDSSVKFLLVTYNRTGLFRACYMRRLVVNIEQKNCLSNLNFVDYTKLSLEIKNVFRGQLKPQPHPCGLLCPGNGEIVELGNVFRKRQGITNG